jgi:hypothetical protein
VLAVLGRAAAHFIPPSPAPDPALAINWNPFSETWRNLRLAAVNRTVLHSLLGISWLWFFGSIFLTSFTPFARDVLGGDENVVTLLLAVFSGGIGIGALACERLSGRKVEIGLVPFGSIGMTVFAVDLWLASRGMHPRPCAKSASSCAIPGNGASWPTSSSSRSSPGSSRCRSTPSSRRAPSRRTAPASSRRTTSSMRSSSSLPR